MPENFTFSKFLRHEDREHFINHEEKVQKRLSEITVSSIEFKDTRGVILVKITLPNGDIVKDILRKDSINYNYCVGLIQKVLETKNG